MYLLHRYTDDHTGWIQFGEVLHIADRAILSGESTAMIIVMPDADTGGAGYTNALSGKWNYETLRFELKYNVMKSINYLGIYHLRDLTERIDCLKEPLINAWDNVLLFDPTINKNVNEEKKLKYNNIKFWNDISNKNKRSYRYHLKKLKKITDNYSCGIQAQTRDIMMVRLDALV